MSIANFKGFLFPLMKGLWEAIIFIKQLFVYIFDLDEIIKFNMYWLSGKFIVAYIPTCQEKEYYLACACEEIYAPPSAYVSLFGLTVQASFLRGKLTSFLCFISWTFVLRG